MHAGQPHCEKAAQRCVQITLVHPLMTHFSHEIRCFVYMNIKLCQTDVKSDYAAEPTR